MPEEPFAGQALQLLSKHFDVPESVSLELASQKQSTREEARSQLIRVLTPVIRKMLDQSFEQLIHILYRIDLSESKVVELLERSAPDRLATLLTEAIVDRQLEKVSLREKYRDSEG